jgi:hypothetical protein
LPKKIELDLLLPDLALEFGDPLRRGDVVSRDFARPLPHSLCNDPIALARPAQRPERLGSARPKQLSPGIEILAQYRQLLRKSLYLLARQNPANRLKLEFTAEFTR